MKGKIYAYLIIWIFAILFHQGVMAGTSVEETLHKIKNVSDYPNYTLIAAHRGYWEHYPENSKPAYDAAIKAGGVPGLNLRGVRMLSDVKFYNQSLDFEHVNDELLRQPFMSPYSQLMTNQVNSADESYSGGGGLLQIVNKDQIDQQLSISPDWAGAGGKAIAADTSDKRIFNYWSLVNDPERENNIISQLVNAYSGLLITPDNKRESEISLRQNTDIIEQLGPDNDMNNISWAIYPGETFPIYDDGQEPYRDGTGPFFSISPTNSIDLYNLTFSQDGTARNKAQETSSFEPPDFDQLFQFRYAPIHHSLKDGHTYRIIQGGAHVMYLKRGAYGTTKMSFSSTPYLPLVNAMANWRVSLDTTSTVLFTNKVSYDKLNTSPDDLVITEDFKFPTDYYKARWVVLYDNDDKTACPCRLKKAQTFAEKESKVVTYDGSDDVKLAEWVSGTSNEQSLSFYDITEYDTYTFKPELNATYVIQSAPYTEESEDTNDKLTESEKNLLDALTHADDARGDDGSGRKVLSTQDGLMTYSTDAGLTSQRWRLEKAPKVSNQLQFYLLVNEDTGKVAYNDEDSNTITLKVKDDVDTSIRAQWYIEPDMVHKNAMRIFLKRDIMDDFVKGIGALNSNATMQTPELNAPHQLWVFNKTDNR